jgi:hypothetical protein
MKTGSLRELIRAGEFLHMPAVYDPLGGLVVQNSGFKVCFVGGYRLASPRRAAGALWLARSQLLYLLRKTVNMETQHVQQFSISTMTLRPTQFCLGVFPIHLQLFPSHMFSRLAACNCHSI